LNEANKDSENGELEHEERKPWLVLGAALGVTIVFSAILEWYADGIPTGDALAVAMHEVAAHLGMRKLLGDKQYNAVIDRILDMAQSDTASTERALAQRALARIPGEDIKRGPEAARDEAVAYFVEELATKFGAEVVLFQVVSMGYYNCTSEGACFTAYDQRQIDADKASAKTYLDKVATQMKQKGVKIISEETEVKKGSISTEVTEGETAAEIAEELAKALKVLEGLQANFNKAKKDGKKVGEILIIEHNGSRQVHVENSGIPFRWVQNSKGFSERHRWQLQRGRT
jgi:nucleotide-binding universal stress UspA family protein